MKATISTIEKHIQTEEKVVRQADQQAARFQGRNPHGVTMWKNIGDAARARISMFRGNIEQLTKYEGNVIDLQAVA